MTSFGIFLFFEKLKIFVFLELRELNYEHSQKLNLMQLHYVMRQESPGPAGSSSPEYGAILKQEYNWPSRQFDTLNNFKMRRVPIIKVKTMFKITEVVFF